MYKRKVNVLVIEPGEYPKRVTILNSKEGIKAYVCKDSCFICDLRLINLDNNVYAVSNKDAELLGLKGNRKIGELIISGTILILETNNDGIIIDISSLNYEKYMQRFWNIEIYSDEEVNDSFWYEIKNLS